MVTSLENGLVDFEEFAADFLSRHGKIEERNRIKAAGTKTACTGRKFAENWKIINCQTTLKKLAWSAPGCSLAGIFFFFSTRARVNFRSRWYWLICLKSSRLHRPAPTSASLSQLFVFCLPSAFSFRPPFFLSKNYDLKFKKRKGKENILFPHHHWQWQIWLYIEISRTNE